MKRLMCTIALAMIASIMHAATVDWSTGRVPVPGTDGTGYGTGSLSGTAYTATVYFYTDEACTKAFAAGGVTSSSTVSSKAIKGTTGDTFTDGTYYTKIVIASGTSTLTSNVGSFTVDNSASDPNVSITFYNGAGLGGSNLFPSSGWSAVPEPTSAMLLLFGVAGLVLKRKRA